MPIYEYRCQECHQVFEEWCKHVEEGAAVRSCPICKGQAKRLVSNTSFALKGTGWYATEYGTHKHRGGADSAVPPASTSEAAGSSAPPSGAEKVAASAEVGS